MNLIAAVTADWGIGRDGKLLFRIPEDMKHFKNHTENKVVIMGHNTLKSLPESKPLKNRLNIVLSRNKNIAVENAVVLHSIDDIFTATAKYAPDDIYVVGGQTIYEQLLDYCKRAYITKIDVVGSNADKFFPNLDKMSNWELVSQSPAQIHEDISLKVNLPHGENDTSISRLCAKDMAENIKYYFTEYINRFPK